MALTTPPSGPDDLPAVLYVRGTRGLNRRIDERREGSGLTRSEWVVRALEWALSQPVRKTIRRSEETL